MIEPMKTAPIFKQYIWGGNNLNTKYGKDIPDNFASESWEVAVHEDGKSTIANGKYKGKTLGRVIAIEKNKLIGDRLWKNYEKFPLLIKFLDANDRLSVQVHPNDEYAKVNENGELGKTEMWYVLDAKEGAKLIYGFNCDLTKQEFNQVIANGDLEGVLNYVDAKAGDCFFINAGRLHAVGEGLLIAEIQQNSNTTYRVYDYDRKDKDGALRPLHTKKAIEVTTLENSTSREKTNYTTIIDIKSGNSYANLVDCQYFKTQKWDIKDVLKAKSNKNFFEILICTEGRGEIKYMDATLEFSAGDSIIIPAYLGNYTINGRCQLLKTWAK